MTKTKLQIMREKKGLTVEQLAEKIIESNNFTAIALQEIVEDLKNFEIELEPIKLGYNAVFIAKALGCSVDELVEE
ncbi:helix-turn-helix domain-containing protein [Lactococcus garvieae]|uniref:helix-turn-helix domain-containing protein n=1 Tax=Lactococcus garvieae TaxID=1363 RepID=UPI000301610B|nr:helix-turn-helix transcriptional regulator [Lactococcus garvieae]